MLALSSCELVNLLLVLFRRKKILAAAKARALAVLARLPLTLDDDGPRLACEHISELAADQGLAKATGVDARK